MKIVLITPARPSSRSGNATTTVRWTRILRELGHDVHVADHYDGSAADLMIAIHAWRSADGIRDFRARFPDRPLIVALSGTDIYEYIDRDPAPTLLLGSHLDSVRDAGKYDGPLGVLVALAAFEALHARGARLPFAIELCAFADEEGLR